MKSTLTIILLSLLVLVLGYLLLFPTKSEELESEPQRIRDSAMVEYDKLQKVYNKTDERNRELTAELLTQKAVVKRSEQKLSELLKRERHAQIENKKVFGYSDFQLDSAFRSMYPRADSSLHK